MLVIYTGWMLFLVMQWSFAFTSNPPQSIDGLGIAAVVGAVGSPVVALMGYVSKLYCERTK